MNKPQEIANSIILKTYKNNGKIEFAKLNLETWHSYSLNAYGSDFASQGAFQGLEQERKIDRTAKRFSILAVAIAFASLIVSIIAICK